MKELIEKISSYNLFNYLLPGILFSVAVNSLTPYSFIQKDIVIGFFVYYFIGLVISRFGSLVIEPILKRISFLKFADYKDFISASKKDSRINIFSEENNMYRTFCSMFILLILLKLYYFINLKFQILERLDIFFLIVLLLFMFLFAYRKQTQYIVKRINAVLNKD